MNKLRTSCWRAHRFLMSRSRFILFELTRGGNTVHICQKWWISDTGEMSLLVKTAIDVWNNCWQNGCECTAAGSYIKINSIVNLTTTNSSNCVRIIHCIWFYLATTCFKCSTQQKWLVQAIYQVHRGSPPWNNAWTPSSQYLGCFSHAFPFCWHFMNAALDVIQKRSTTCRTWSLK